MTLSAPSRVYFLISLVLAILALAGHFLGMSLGLKSFYWLIASYAVLLAGCLFPKV